MRSHLRCRLRRLALLTPLALFHLLDVGGVSAANPYIQFGGPTEANGWAKVHVEIYYSDTERYGPYGSTTSLLGTPVEHNYLVLDTGANAILIVAEAAAELENTNLANGYNTVSQFQETGIAGTAYLNVSAPYYFDVIDSDAVRRTLPKTADDVRILSDSQENLGSGNLASSLVAVPGIAGMPLIVNHVTTFDTTPWITTPDLLTMPDLRVVMSDDLPAEDGFRYTVLLNNDTQFDAADGRPDFEPPDSALPTWADIPFLDVTCRYDSTNLTGNFLLDTGATMPILTDQFALALGMDSNGDGVLGSGPGGDDDGYIGDATVGGLGGSTTVPIMTVNSISITTEEGVDLVWTDPNTGIQVIVLPGLPGEIQGALSVDLLTSGVEADLDNWDSIFDPLPPIGEPYFRKIHLDFREPDVAPYGTMYLDVSPVHHNVVPEPGSLALLLLGGAVFLLWRSRPRRASW